MGNKCIENASSRSIPIETVYLQRKERKAFLLACREQSPRKWLCKKGQREEEFSHIIGYSLMKKLDAN
jgi:hypothetical protein